jgi:biopolymer transport protein ExbB
MPQRLKLGRVGAMMALLALVWILAGPTVMAADSSTPPASGTSTTKGPDTVEGMSLFETIKAGGLIGGVIIVLLLFAIALVIEHAWTIRRGAIMPPELLADIEEAFDKEEYEQAIAICEEQPTFFTNVIATGLSRVNAGYKQMEEAMAEAGEEAATQLQHKIGYMALIANIAPMLGLLGTVQGMILAFQQIATTSAPKPAELAGDIQLALVTTFLGLMVAIPVMCVYQFFKNRVEKIVLEVGGISSELMARFRPVE